MSIIYKCTPLEGKAGASRAFVHERCRRMLELQQILGVMMFPGTLNTQLDRDFNYDARHLKVSLLDKVSPGKDNWDHPWQPRPCRIWPMLLDGHIKCWAIRFDDKKYKHDFTELMSDTRLRDHIGKTFTLEHRNAT